MCRKIEEQVKGTASDRIAGDGFDRQTKCVPVRHSTQIDATARRKSNVPPRAGIYLHDLELSIAIIVLELRIENASIVQRRPQALKRVDRSPDLMNRNGFRECAVSKHLWVHAEAAPRNQCADPVVPVYKSVDQ